MKEAGKSMRRRGDTLTVNDVVDEGFLVSLVDEILLPVFIA
jgi:hypothetical protein